MNERPARRLSLAARIGLSLLSFVFPGIGHGAIGQRGKMLGWTSFGALTWITTLYSVWAAWCLGALRLACAVETFVAIARASRQPTPDPLAGALAGAIAGKPKARISNRALAVFSLVIGAIGSAFAASAVEAFAAPSSSMAPTLMPGDRFFVDKLTIRWRAPERGEVIVFRSPCTQEITYVKRVIAVGGDTLEVRCGSVYVNGAAIKSELVDPSDCSYEDDGRWVECSRYRETAGPRTYDVFHARELTQRSHFDFPKSDGTPLPSCEGRRPHRAPGRIVATQPEGSEHGCQPHLHYVVPEGHLFVMGDNRENSNDSRFWGALPDDHVVGRVTGIWLPFARAGALD